MSRKPSAPRRTTEVVADDPDILLTQEIALDAIELVRRMLVADRCIDENARAAALNAVVMALEFVRRTTNRLRGLPGFPVEMPGIALERLGLELEDLDMGTVGPILSQDNEQRRSSTRDKTGARRGRRPPQTTKILMLRAEVAMWVQLLYQLRPTLEAAAAEAASILKNHPILARVKNDHATAILRWRTAVQEGGAGAAHYESSLSEATRMFRTLGQPAAVLIKIVHDRLRKLDKP
jgi:hypothetical protein